MGTKKRSSFASFIGAVYIITLIVFCISLGFDVSKGKEAAERRFRKLTNETAESLKDSDPRSEAFYDAFLHSLGNVSDLAGVQVKDAQGAVIAYPADLGEDGIRFSDGLTKPFTKSTKLNAKNGQEVTLTAAIYLLKPATLYARLRITFLVILAATLICLLYLIYVSLYGTTDESEEKDEDEQPELIETDEDEEDETVKASESIPADPEPLQQQESVQQPVTPPPPQSPAVIVNVNTVPGGGVTTETLRENGTADPAPEEENFVSRGFGNYELTQEEYDGLLSDEIDDQDDEDPDDFDLDDDEDLEVDTEPEISVPMPDSPARQEQPAGGTAETMTDDELFDAAEDDESLFDDEPDEPSFVPGDAFGEAETSEQTIIEPAVTAEQQTAGKTEVEKTVAVEHAVAAEAEEAAQTDSEMPEEPAAPLEPEEVPEAAAEQEGVQSGEATVQMPLPEKDDFPAEEADDDFPDEESDVDFPVEKADDAEIMEEPVPEQNTKLPGNGTEETADDDELFDSLDDEDELDVDALDEDTLDEELNGKDLADGPAESAPADSGWTPREIPSIDDSIFETDSTATPDTDEIDSSSETAVPDDTDSTGDEPPAPDPAGDETDRAAESSPAQAFNQEAAETVEEAEAEKTEVLETSENPDETADLDTDSDQWEDPDDDELFTVIDEDIEEPADIQEAAAESDTMVPETGPAATEMETVAMHEEAAGMNAEPEAEPEPEPETAAAEAETAVPQAEAATTATAEPALEAVEPAPETETVVPDAADPAPSPTPAGPSGLYSERTGFGWESYMLPRVDNEILRCTKSNQDISVISLRIAGIDWTKDEGQAVCSRVKELLNSPDLIFEKGDDAFTAALPDTNVNEAISVAEDLYASIDEILAQYKSDSIIGIGISSRSLRMISGERLSNEAEVALNHAMEDENSPIVAFKVDPQKYRNFLAAQAEQEEAHL